MRQAIVRLMALWLGAALIAGCGQPASVAPTAISSQAAIADDLLYQYSLLSALMAGVYEGELSVAQLRSKGDLGLGTLNRLDGELVVVDGEVFDIPVNGRARRVGDNELTPFAAVTRFEADQTLELSDSLTLTELKEKLDQARGSNNLPYAVRIDGQFASIRTRSVPAQAPPYRPLTEVLKTQQEFEFSNVSGTILGFWMPEYADPANASGYHLHFITADRTAGGHLLEATIRSASAALDQTSEWLMDMPASGPFLTSGLSQESYK